MIDFHTHSTFSDGTLSPEQLIEYAHQNGLNMLALTDHDTIGGLKRAQNAALKRNIAFIPGIELSAQNKGQLHILGLSIDINHPIWDDVHLRMRESRERRNELIVNNLKQLGISISMADLSQQAKDSVSRVHIARLLVEKGICEDIKSAFNEYLLPNGKAYHPRTLFSAEECIHIIHKANGLAVIAHLNKVNIGEYTSYFSFMEHMKTLGADGLECYYHDYSVEFSQECQDIARKLGLIMTGGSDFHGQNKDNRIGRTQFGVIPEYLYSQYCQNR